MAFTITNRDLIHREQIRIPMPHLGANQEFFKLTGMVHFNGDDARDDQSGARGQEALSGNGEMHIHVDYRNIVPSDNAILPSQWTDLVGISNLKCHGPDTNKAWAIRDYWIKNEQNAHENSNGNVFLPGGHLGIYTNVYLDPNSYIVMMTYDITIIGEVVDFRTGLI